MAETFQDTISGKAPPKGIQDFYFGAGQGVPGMYPLLNQATANYFATMGMPGGSPYSYQDPRIAGFSPAQQAGMEIAAGGVGSYLPYYQQKNYTENQAMLQEVLMAQQQECTDKVLISLCLRYNRVLVL